MNIEGNSRGILAAFFRQSSSFLLMFVLIFGGGIFYAFTAQDIYRAQGSILIKLGQDALPNVKLDDKAPSLMQPDERKDFIGSSLKIFQSHHLLSQVVKEVGVKRIYPEIAAMNADEGAIIEAAVSRLQRKDLTVEGDKTNLIELGIKNPDPQVAAEMAKRLIDLFIKTQMEIYNNRQVSFIQQQIEEARLRVERSRNEFTAFKEETGISALDDEMAQLLKEKGDLTTISLQALTAAQSALAELEAKEAEMKSTYQSDSPMLERLRQSTDVARKQVQARQADVKASSGQGGGSSTLSHKIAAIEARMAFLEAQRGRYTELEQRVKIAETHYEYYQQRGEEARANNLLDTQDITRVVVIDEPVVPTQPVQPRIDLLLALFFVAAMLVSIGVVVIRELMDDRFTRPEQLASELDLPVLVTFNRQ